MENLEMICFKIISAVGSARSSYVEAMRAARKGDFDLAAEKYAEGQKMYKEGHSHHALLVQQEAKGEKTDVSLLLLHTEDQMMAAEVLGVVSEELIELHKMKS